MMVEPDNKGKEEDIRVLEKRKKSRKIKQGQS
jgi:hypothetical protein